MAVNPEWRGAAPPLRTRCDSVVRSETDRLVVLLWNEAEVELKGTENKNGMRESKRNKNRTLLKIQDGLTFSVAVFIIIQ